MRVVIGTTFDCVQDGDVIRLRGKLAKDRQVDKQ